MIRSLVCPSVPLSACPSLPSPNDGIFISIILIFMCMSCLINERKAKKNLVPFYIIRKLLYIFVFAKKAKKRKRKAGKEQEEEVEKSHGTVGNGMKQIWIFCSLAFFLHSLSVRE